MATIADSVKRVHNGANFYIALGDFLDEFYRQPSDIQYEMISESPDDEADINPAHMALFAATAHKLANDFGLPSPDWTMDSRYKMTKAPYFDCNARGKLRLLFMYKSPSEFKHRNLFVDENFLARV